MRKWFGSIDPSGPEAFLKSRGYTLTPEWRWVKPTLSHTMSGAEAACICFLIDEWDYGGLA
jgi:hypothetical protein